MVESGYVFSQTEYDASLGLAPELQGSVAPEAQLERFRGLVEQGVPEEFARQQLGLTDKDFEVANQGEHQWHA